MKGLLIGCRIPRDYFISEGKGESDITVHAGSYHLALKAAGIEMCNIMTYSSIMPGIAREVERPESMTHGQVMETIMAVATAATGEVATAGIVFGWLYDRETQERFGGLVCEYNGNLTEEEARSQLGESLDELYENGFSERFEIRDAEYHMSSIIPKKKYGTALVSINFINYEVPVLE
ncbi:arginine decarboxylase [Candidatus Woesearchaeota archaeon]|nr:arginine decarboxylase [Candidatus Woesearchaeota archaeon]